MITEIMNFNRLLWWSIAMALAASRFVFTRLADKTGAVLPPGAVLTQVTLLVFGDLD
ncbi:hypothetical protein NP493_1988g00024 [Ridgeia piscesae]|uniref:Uncharacterized protein n=1 Tax=Ridgeia piscesae TaxID=27915 RepID=A0AAD9JND3_RIDPI|nr:hypothetical protein NP493_1988g00024 [Ridgeia piscesae]